MFDEPHKDYYFNNVLVTAYKKWAVNLMLREARGEQLPHISKESWREVLGFDTDQSAKKAAELWNGLE